MRLILRDIKIAPQETYPNFTDRGRCQAVLTRKMLKLYRIMEDYKERNGVMPSYDEMVDMMGVKSKSGINRLIESMEERGAIERIPRKARAIRLLDLP